MAKYFSIGKKSDGASKVVSNFLGDLLRQGVVDSILVPQRLGDTVVPGLVKDPEKSSEFEPFAPTVSSGMAKLVGSLTRAQGNEKVASILHPCELRAVVELAKFNQADLKQLVTIGFDCPGAYSDGEFRDFVRRKAENDSIGAAFIKRAFSEDPGSKYRETCSTCNQFLARGADITILLFGSDSSEEIIIEAGDRMSEVLRGHLNLKTAEPPAGREATIAQLSKERGESRKALFETAKREIGSLDSMVGLFSECVKCQNCQRACPICYCPQCVFDTAALQYTAERLANLAAKNLRIRLPADTILFHLTRMNHMVTSCVGCGICEDACPRDIPVARVFRYMASHVQPIFDYEAGRDPCEEAPVATFKEEELETV